MLLWLLKRRLRGVLVADINQTDAWKAWLEAAESERALWDSATNAGWLIHLAYVTDVRQTRIVQATLDGVGVWLTAFGLGSPLTISPLTTADWEMLRDPSRRSLAKLDELEEQLLSQFRRWDQTSEGSDIANTGRAIFAAFHGLVAGLHHHETRGSHELVCLGAQQAVGLLSMVASAEVREKMIVAVRNPLRER